MIPTGEQVHFDMHEDCMRVVSTCVCLLVFPIVEGGGGGGTQKLQ